MRWTPESVPQREPREKPELKITMKNNLHDIKENHPSGLFTLGEIIVTEGAIGGLPPNKISEGIARHQSGDWGAPYIPQRPCSRAWWTAGLHVSIRSWSEVLYHHRGRPVTDNGSPHH